MSPPAAVGDAGPVGPSKAPGELSGVAVAVALVEAGAGGVEPRATGAGPEGRRNRYHAPAAAARTTARTMTASRGPRREVGWGAVIAGSSGATGAGAVM